MTKTSTNAEFNAFIQGLLTEASPLNFPPNASVDEQNFELSRKGTRSRRLGIDFEEGYTLHTSSLVVGSPGKLNVFYWAQPNNIPTLNLAVVQDGNSLKFFNMETEPVSGNLIGTLTLSDFATDSRFSFAAVDGRLIVGSGFKTPALITYDGTSFSFEYITIKTRDVWGIEEDVNTENDTSLRPTTLDDKHRYNLHNQSWGIPRKNASGILMDPLTIYNSELNKFPSNTEQVWPGLQFQANGSDPYERIFPKLYDDVYGAVTTTPRGYFIIDAVDRGASRTQAYAANFSKYPQLVSSSLTFPQDRTEGGPKFVAEFAGRVFYAGFSGQVSQPDKRSPSLSSMVFFSQLVKNSQDYGKCYQEGDPTSRSESDIVDTDGGFIKLSGVETILGLVPMKTYLVVLATNGIWAITGGSDYGFSATNYKSSRISTYGVISPTSVADDGNILYYWAEEGIIAVGTDAQGALSATSITKATIDTFYSDIPNESKTDAVGILDSNSMKVRWVYSIGNPFETTFNQYELIFDINIKAFYKHRIYNSPNALCYIGGYIKPPKIIQTTTTMSVYSSVDPVLSDVDNVIASVSLDTTPDKSIRYLCLFNQYGTIKFTFGYYKNSEFRDWVIDNGGSDAYAFVITGDQTAGDSSRHKQIPYATVHFYRTEDGINELGELTNQSSCLISTQWDWNNETISNKWTIPREGYRIRRGTADGSDFTTGRKLVTTKNKLRGRGRAFAMMLETTPYKDCQIAGWALSINGNQNV